MMGALHPSSAIMTIDPLYLSMARQYIGIREIKGIKYNNRIKQLWLNLINGLWYWTAYGRDDSKLPWCGAFIAKSLKDAGLTYPKNYASALAWRNYGVDAGKPVHGAIAVIQRNGGGHVTFVTGISADGKFFRGLGGNQDDSVNESWFLISRVVAWRLPADTQPIAPLVAKVGSFSSSEA